MQTIHTAESYLTMAGINQAEIDRLVEIGYFYAPASKGHHLAISGGLWRHSVNVVDNMLSLKAFDDEKSCYKVGMLHDLVKCYCYKLNGDRIDWVNPSYPGHGTASALIAMELGISLTPVESAAIVWHMGAFNLTKNDAENYYSAIKRFGRPIVLTHTADHLASIQESEQ